MGRKANAQFSICIALLYSKLKVASTCLHGDQACRLPLSCRYECILPVMDAFCPAICSDIQPKWTDQPASLRFRDIDLPNFLVRCHKSEPFPTTLPHLFLRPMICVVGQKKRMSPLCSRWAGSMKQNSCTTWRGADSRVARLANNCFFGGYLFLF